MQSLPVVGVSVDRTLPLSEAKEDSGTFIITLSKPAPVGGLLVNFSPVQTDGGGDLNVSIVNGTAQIDENNSPSGILIEEGKKEATITITAIEDNIPEGEEISGFDLLPGDGYTIDPDNNSPRFIITDLPIVTFSVDKTVISEGGEPQLYTFELSEPAPNDGLTVKLVVESSDGKFGDVVGVPELFNNINASDAVVVEENGLIAFEVTILPGATSANFGLEAPQDNLVEGNETFTFTLLDDESYSIDPAQAAITTTIIDKELPTVSFSVDKTVISEGGEPQIYTFQLSEPAPNGGLTVRLQGKDSDTDPADPIPVQQLFNNISNVGLARENGLPVFEFTIAEGEKSATFGLEAPQDNLVEGDETFSLTFLDDESYSIDPSNASITTTIIDKELPTVSFSVDKTVISEGGEPQIFTLQLNEPAPDGGLTVRLQLEDPDGDFGDGGFPPQLFNNISDANFVVENGKFIQEFTISPGATEASFVFIAGEDNKVEGDETYTLTLLDGEDYSINTESKPIVTTITEKEVINGTEEAENLFGTDAAEFIIGFQGNDTIFGNGGEDNLIGNEGDDLIYGASQTDTILGGEGNDTIFGNGGGDLINSGSGEDSIWLGAGKATVILETSEGFDTVNNFQLGATTFQVESIDNLSFADSTDGAKIFQGDDLLAVVSWQSAHTFTENQDTIFIV